MDGVTRYRAHINRRRVINHDVDDVRHLIDMPESEDRARGAIDAAHGAPAEPVRNVEDAEG
jgi:hypothetical protein